VRGFTHLFCGNYAAANALVDEVVALANEKGALFWKVQETLGQGALLALTGKASGAVQIITSGITAFRSTGATWLVPPMFSYLANANAKLGQFNDAWRCVGEAMTAVKTTKEGLWEAEVNRVAGEIALKSPHLHAANAQASTASEVLGATGRDEHGAALA
jgi:predicted ATPase